MWLTRVTSKECLPHRNVSAISGAPRVQSLSENVEPLGRKEERIDKRTEQFKQLQNPSGEPQAIQKSIEDAKEELDCLKPNQT